MSEVKKVVLAYSDGLDTSIIIPWLKEHYNNCEVIAVCGNVGQKGELEGLEERAKASGASKLYIEDLTDEFVEDYVIPTMQAGVDYEGYLLGTSFARPILAKRVVEIARAEGADAVCHGSTGNGNDQVRFELAIMPPMGVAPSWSARPCSEPTRTLWKSSIQIRSTTPSRTGVRAASPPSS